MVQIQNLYSEKQLPLSHSSTFPVSLPRGNSSYQILCVLPEIVYTYTTPNFFITQIQDMLSCVLLLFNNISQRSFRCSTYRTSSFFLVAAKYSISCDKGNIHILKYGEVILAYTCVNLNLMLTKTACLWPIKHTLYICFNY